MGERGSGGEGTLIRWLALGLWYAAILFTSSLTSSTTTDNALYDYLIAKAGHVFVYAILGWLTSEVLMASAAGLSVGRRTALTLTMVLGAVLASLDETRQSFVYGRTGMVSDVILDTVSASGGALLHHWLTPRPQSAPLDQPAGDVGQ